MFEALLFLTTIASLATSLVLGVMLRRLAGVERDRSAARVAALAAAAGLHQAGPVPRPEPEPPPSERLEDEWELGEVEPVAPATALPREESTPAFPAAPPPVLPSSSTEQSGSQPFASANRAATPEDRRQRRLALAAAAVGMLVVGGFALLVTSRGAAVGAAEAATASVPLDLLRLSHERAANTITVHGAVRNPAEGATLPALDAVVQLFDRNGRVVAESSGRTADAALIANEETTFSVTIGAPGDVARYRVSFRSGSRAVTHIDRRGGGPPAEPVRNDDPSRSRGSS